MWNFLLGVRHTFGRRSASPSREVFFWPSSSGGRLVKGYPGIGETQFQNHRLCLHTVYK